MMRLLIILLSFAATVGCRRSPPLPDISTKHADPVVAEQIGKTLTEAKASPRSGAAWGKLGLVLRVAGMQAEAARCFIEAERLDPKNPRWAYFQDTVQSLERAASLTNATFIRTRLAQRLLDAGRWSEAEEHFRAAGHALGLAQVACAQGKWPEALPHLQRAQHDNAPKAATALLASVNLRLGRTNEARALSAQAAEMPPDPELANPFEAEAKQYAVGKRAWMEQAQEALAQGDMPSAGPLIDRLVSRYPDSPEGWLYLGRACIIQSNLVVAEQALSRHLQLDPPSVDGHLQMGLVRYHQKRLSDAAAEFLTVLKSKPDSEYAHYFLGQIRRQMKDREGAIKSLQEALRCDPAFEPARKALDELAAKR